jgi:glycerol-3-phosphate acyltransferase PlsY
MTGIDPRQQGSGNIGATNVLRTSGKVVGVLTLGGDILKGFIPVFLAARTHQPPLLTSAVALSALMGHLYPLYLRFKGGKGVATALGIFLPIAPWAVLLDVGVFSAVVWVGRTVSMGSLAASVALPLLLTLLGIPPIYILLAVIVGLLVFYRHRENIRRLIRHQESKFTLRS